MPSPINEVMISDPWRDEKWPRITASVPHNGGITLDYSTNVAILSNREKLSMPLLYCNQLYEPCGFNRYFSRRLRREQKRVMCKLSLLALYIA